MLIQIDGWYGGGKSVLWALLDGHKDIFVSPIHEYAFQAFLPYSNSDSWVVQKDTEFLRHILSKTGYYRLEEAYLQKEFDFLISSNNKITIPFKMDFYDFDQKYIQKIAALKVWNISLLCELLYETYYECSNHIPKNGKYPKYYASMGHPQPIEYYMNMSKVLPTSKRILIKRDIKDVIATRCTRSITSTGKKIGTPFEDIIKSDEIYNLIKYYEEFNILEERNPSQFYVVHFEDLIYNTKETMTKVAFFLGIYFEDILSIPTMSNIILENNGESSIGKKNDNYIELLTPKEIDTVNIEIDLYSLKKELLTISKKPFPLKLSHILAKFETLKNDYEKIMIYGNGYLGKLLGKSLESKLVMIIDKNENILDASNIISLKEVNNYKYDIIIISVLEREEEIIKDLQDFGISLNKIRVLI